MVNTAPLPSNSVYGREKWFWYNKFTTSENEWQRGAVVWELPCRADEVGSTP